MTITITAIPKRDFGVFEDAEDRNYTFEEKEYIINNVMYRRAAMIRAARMDKEDVRQELSLRLLELLDLYNPERCPNLDAYLTMMLSYHLLHVRRKCNLIGMTALPKGGIRYVSLNQEGLFGNFPEAPFWDAEVSTVWLEELIDMLPQKQRAAIDRKLSGVKMKPGHKALKAARVRLRRQIDERQLQYA